jgi:hypothetical protein
MSFEVLKPETWTTGRINLDHTRNTQCVRVPGAKRKLACDSNAVRWPQVDSWSALDFSLRLMRWAAGGTPAIDL